MSVVKKISIADEIDKERAREPAGVVIMPQPVGVIYAPQVVYYGYTGQTNTIAPNFHEAAMAQPSAVLATQCSGADNSGRSASSRKVKVAGDLTTIFFRNVPNNYNGKKILELLDTSGFKNGYDFVYVPHDFKRLPSLVNLGYFFVNFATHEVAVKALEKFEGYHDWTMDSTKVLAVSWAQQTQGQKACIKRYRNCPVMHETVPVECKPMVFENGTMVPFTPSKKKIKQPRFKKGLFPEVGDEPEPDEEPDEEPPAELQQDCLEDGVEEKEETLEEILGGRLSTTSSVWMPDESAACCTVCEEPFTIFRRRHHCRKCGSICCAECAPRTVSKLSSLLRRAQKPTYKRVCKDCDQGITEAVACSPLSRPSLPCKVKNTFIDVGHLEASMNGDTFLRSSIRQTHADSFPF